MFLFSFVSRPLSDDCHRPAEKRQRSATADDIVIGMGENIMIVLSFHP